MKKILFYVFIGIFSLFVIFNITLRVTNIDKYAVTTGSMEPKIKVGSLIYVKDYKEDIMDNLEIDDVITYKTSGNNLFTHRIVEINKEENYVITKGYNDDTISEKVELNQILGKYLFQIPLIGYITILFRNIYFDIILGLLIALGIVIYLLVKYTKKTKTE